MNGFDQLHDGLLALFQIGGFFFDFALNLCEPCAGLLVLAFDFQSARFDRG